MRNTSQDTYTKANLTVRRVFNRTTVTSTISLNDLI